MNESFELIGRVNIGNKYENHGNGGYGVEFVFTTAAPGTVGLVLV